MLKPGAMKNPSQITQSTHYTARDRFEDHEYLIDQKNYYYIMDLINFYHDSIYSLPDNEIIQAEKIEDEQHTTPCNVPVNHLVFT